MSNRSNKKRDLEVIMADALRVDARGICSAAELEKIANDLLAATVPDAGPAQDEQPCALAVDHLVGAFSGYGSVIHRSELGFEPERRSQARAATDLENVRFGHDPAFADDNHPSDWGFTEVPPYRMKESPRRTRRPRW